MDAILPVNVLPRASRNLIASFVKDIRKLSIGLMLAMYVSVGHENFVK